MTKMGSSYWNVSGFSVSYKNKTLKTQVSEIQLDPSFVAATPLNFSYHCSDPAAVQPANKTASSDASGVSVKFTELQVSP